MDDLDRFFTLVRVETAWFEGLDEHLFRETGLRLAAFDLIRTIRETDGCRVQDIVHEIGITVGAVSKAVDRLERSGWVERRRHPTDRRSSVIVLTPAGTEQFERALPLVEREIANRFSALGTARTEALVDALRALRDGLEASD
ncbi:MarR family winged helix-turn-helix transcriptional regulator [Agromyces sp. LHK192]|uniref:MarR family winged helix-turn-helix transcriptional regulator n=1 Tax=Agromyces sp. LHK192 TaxID=2498704 RepID=UPI000FDB4A8A|nr:MarR family transcriptional regulator [Agromyces sp. LHK192]